MKPGCRGRDCAMRGHHVPANASPTHAARTHRGRKNNCLPLPGKPRIHTKQYGNVSIHVLRRHDRLINGSGSYIADFGVVALRGKDVFLQARLQGTNREKKGHNVPTRFFHTQVRGKHRGWGLLHLPLLGPSLPVRRRGRRGRQPMRPRNGRERKR